MVESEIINGLVAFFTVVQIGPKSWKSYDYVELYGKSITWSVLKDIHHTREA